MPETLTDVTSPSITRKFSLLLDLPIEIQIEIIELLQYGQSHPFKSVRLTCKHLEALCNPVFAEFISIKPLSWSALELRKELAPKFAKYLKAIACFISEHGGAKELVMELVLTAILERAVRLQRISLRYGGTDAKDHSQLLSAISRLSALEEVRIRELSYSSPYSTVQSTFHHRLLNNILDYHSQRLRVLVVRGSAPMHESTFVKLRDTASQLRHLELGPCLAMENRGAFVTLKYGPVRAVSSFSASGNAPFTPQLSHDRLEMGYLARSAYSI
jgi:hypothetical protein